MIRPTAYVACQQIARAIGDATGLTFVEAASASPGGIYAAALPVRAHRLSPAISVTPISSPGPEDSSPISVQLVTLLCRADDAQTAVAILEGVRDIFRPGGSPWCAPLVRGILGAPPASVLSAGAETGVWRFTGIEVVVEPEPLTLGSGPSAAPSGEGEAQMRLGLRGGGVVLADLGGVATSGVPSFPTFEVDAVAARLTNGGVTTVVSLAGRTVAQVFTEMGNVAGFAATLDSAGRGALPAAGALLGFTQQDEADLQTGVRIRGAFTT